MEELILFDEEDLDMMGEPDREYYEYLRAYGSPEEIAAGNEYFGK